MERIDVAIVGAGVVGLSVAASTAREGRSVFVLERHESFGQETSSRNSEVIHASIYYPPDSLKGRLCLEGNERMYLLAREQGLPLVNCGKLIVATDDAGAERLPALLGLAKGNGAKGVRIVGPDEIRRLEPKVRAVAAIHCPTSGVVDSHALMRLFSGRAADGGASFAYGHEVVALEKVLGGWVVVVRQPDGEEFRFEAKVVVNCAGLGAGRIAALAGLDVDALGYRIHPRKGCYFRVLRGLAELPEMLIYPVPPLDHTVGIHTCPDLAGGMRLGPHDTWDEEMDPRVDPGLQDLFFEACRPFLPTLRREDIAPDMCGFQAKRFGPGEPTRDFVIRHEVDNGCPGLVDLVGIESPGLTSSPAIGPMVAGIVDAIL
jgi:L-2-hydroxyglutarate oxidase LhgO